MSKIVLDKEKLRTELGIIAFDRLNLNHTSSSYTLGAGAEATIDAITGKTGFCTIMFDGNGDGIFRMRVYVDGSLDDDFLTNETRIGHYSFASSLQVRIYNPTGSSATQTSSGYTLRGLARPS